MSETVRIIGDRQRAYAHRAIDEAPIGSVMRLGAETRRDAQNRRLWPMIEDVRQQVPGFDVYSKEDIKLRFMNALGTEMRFLPTLENDGIFPVGMSSSTLTVAQFSALIELIFAFGAKHNVRWSEPFEQAA